MSVASDAIANVPWSNQVGEITGPVLQTLLTTLLRELSCDTYAYKKAINANATLQAMVPSGTTPVDAMIAYLSSQPNYTPGSNAGQAALTNILATSGGDFETLVLAPWLATLSSSPTIAQLRASALSQTV